jgi:hypothetical protein
MPPSFEWLDPWYGIDAGKGVALERELSHEISPRHILSGEPVQLIARRRDADDALFALTDGRVAEVHLTWKNQMESDPRWPATSIYASREAWARENMRPLHREWIAEQ